MKKVQAFFRHQGKTYMIKSIYRDTVLLDKKLLYHIGTGHYLEVPQDSPIRKQVRI